MKTGGKQFLFFYPIRLQPYKNNFTFVILNLKHEKIRSRISYTPILDLSDFLQAKEKLGVYVEQ